MAIDADEPLEKNFIRKHYLEDIANNKMKDEDARYRVYGCPPGAYGIGILDLPIKCPTDQGSPPISIRSST